MKKYLLIAFLCMAVFVMYGCQAGNSKDSILQNGDASDKITVSDRRSYLADVSSEGNNKYTSFDEVNQAADVVVLVEKTGENAQYVADETWMMNTEGKDTAHQRLQMDGYTVSTVKIINVIRDDTDKLLNGNEITVKEGSCYDEKSNMIVLESVYKKMVVGQRYILLLNAVDSTDYLSAFEARAQYRITGSVYGKITEDGTLETEDLTPLFDEDKEKVKRIMKEGWEEYKNAFKEK